VGGGQSQHILCTFSITQVREDAWDRLPLISTQASCAPKRELWLAGTPNLIRLTGLRSLKINNISECNPRAGAAM